MLAPRGQRSKLTKLIVILWFLSIIFIENWLKYGSIYDFSASLRIGSNPADINRLNHGKWKFTCFLKEFLLLLAPCVTVLTREGWGDRDNSSSSSSALSSFLSLKISWIKYFVDFTQQMETIQGGKGHWTVYYISPQRFVGLFSFIFSTNIAPLWKNLKNISFCFIYFYAKITSTVMEIIVLVWF